MLEDDYPPCPESPSGHRATEVDLDEDPTVATATSSAEEEEEEEAETSFPQANLDVEEEVAEEVATSRKRVRPEEKVESSASDQGAGPCSSPFIDPDTVICASPLAFCPPPLVTKRSKPAARWKLAFGRSAQDTVPVDSGE